MKTLSFPKKDMSGLRKVMFTFEGGTLPSSSGNNFSSNVAREMS